MVTPIGRFVEVSEEGQYLSKERGFMLVSAGTKLVGKVPLDDIAAVMATARGTTVSVSLLAELAERGTPFVVPGANFAPSALLWPIVGHHAVSRRMESQIANNRALSKALWQQVVAAKIRRQGWAVSQSGGSSAPFEFLARRVKLGDEGNLEAQAARRYWPLMFGPQFRRDRDAAGINALLNYGYAVLRAIVARALCATGLHPGVGIFHRHPSNPMPLADDLMEPFRPIVDLTVTQLVRDDILEVGPVAKRRLVATLWQDQKTAQGTTPLMTAILRTSQSLADSYQSGIAELLFPFTDLDGDDNVQNAEWLPDHVDDSDVRPASDDESPA